MDNQTLAERAALEKRNQEIKESNAIRQNGAEESIENEDNAVLDNLLEKLRNGDTVGHRARRARSNTNNRPPNILLDGSLPGDTADIARDMLARLQSDGFPTMPPGSPTVGVGPSIVPRRRRRRPKLGSIHDDEWEMGDGEGLGAPEPTSDDILDAESLHSPSGSTQDLEER
jgi:cytokinesis protein